MDKNKNLPLNTYFSGTEGNAKIASRKLQQFRTVLIKGTNE